MQKAAADVNTYRTGVWGEAEVDEVARVTYNAQARDQLEVPKASWKDFGHHYKQWKNLKVLLGISLSWFFLVRSSTTHHFVAITSHANRYRRTSHFTASA